MSSQLRNSAALPKGGNPHTRRVTEWISPRNDLESLERETLYSYREY